MKKNVFKNGFLFIGIFVALIALYTILLTGAFSFNRDSILRAVAYSDIVIKQEGDYPHVLFLEGGAVLDNYTDHLMTQKMLKNLDKSALYNAMDVDGYARYWHGYLAWLRPLSLFFNMSQMRLIIYSVIFSLALIGVFLLNRRLGLFSAASYALMWLLTFSGVTFGSYQYFACNFLISLGVIIITAFYKSEKKLFGPLFFFITGSFVNFLDLLTYPIATLTVSLTVLCLIEIRENKAKTGRVFSMIIKDSLLWALGYGFTWIAKWGLATIVTKENVFKDALSTGEYRVGKNAVSFFDRLMVIDKNFTVPMLSRTLLVLSVICLIFLWLKKKKNEVLELTPLFLIWIMPYVWYEVFLNHSIIHTFFTFKSQLGSILISLIIVFLTVTEIAGSKKKK